MEQGQVQFSFYITYVLLLTTATVTFIEAMRTNIPNVRHIFNLETCISLIAGYFYSLFVAKINAEGSKVDWNEISQLRYVDWAITTPIMLLALCLVLANNIKEPVHLINMAAIILLNYFMLLVGYMGEIGTMGRAESDLLGFGAFFGMFYMIYNRYVKKSSGIDNTVLFTMYFVVWSLYGVAYLLEEKSKNIMYNVLDMFAKCMIGLGLWVYYTKIVKID
jgi:bacteriorhodopsin